MSKDTEQLSLIENPYEHEIEDDELEEVVEKKDETQEVEQKSDVELKVEEIEKKVAEDLINEVIEEIEEDEEEVFKGADGQMYTKRQWLEPVHVGGPTRKEIEGWKEKYGKNKVCMIVVSGEIFIFRTLKRPEYREVLRDQDHTALDREEIFSEKCTLYPYDFSTKSDKWDAGVCTILSDAIIDRSGFVSTTGIIRL